MPHPQNLPDVALLLVVVASPYPPQLEGRKNVISVQSLADSRSALLKSAEILVRTFQKMD